MTKEGSLRLIVLLAALIQGGALAAAADNPYTPLWLYQGTWRVTRANSAPGAKPDELVNQCALLGTYFTCGQSVNGKPSELLIFTPAEQPGHFYTQAVNPDGRATGRGNLEVSGDHWTFTTMWDQGGQTTYYRTVNVFTGKDKIHFEQAESANRKDFKITGSGDEVRVTRARR